MAEREREIEARVRRELFVHSFIGPALAVGEAGAFASRIGGATVDVHLRPGEAAYRKGDSAEHLFFIVSGQVELVGDETPTDTLGERAILAIDALLNRPRARTALAVGHVHLLRIDAEVWFSMVEDSFEAARNGILRFSSEVQRVELPRLFSADPGGPGGSLGAWPAKPLSLVDRILALRALPLFARGHMQGITMLAERAEELRRREGELLLPSGASPGALFVVIVGEIALPHRDGRAARFAARQVVGGAGAMAPVDGLDRARASAPSVVLRLAHDDYWDVLEEHVDLVRAALAGLALAREALLPSELAT